METVQIVKIGGKVINNDDLLQKVLRDFSRLPHKKVLVHGGGTLATELGERLGVEARLVDGRRITDRESVEITQMAYAGLVNPRIVALLQSFGQQAVGLTGADSDLLRSRKRPAGDIDFGFVGDVTQVNTGFLRLLLQQNLVPVFCALTHDGSGQILNTNADTIATELAIALSKHFATELIFTFEKSGVLSDVSDEQSLIARLTFTDYQQLLSRGAVHQGMRPKLDNAFRALRHGVRLVRIMNADQLENINQKSAVGTVVTLE